MDYIFQFDRVILRLKVRTWYKQIFCSWFRAKFLVAQQRDHYEQWNMVFWTPRLGRLETVGKWSAD